MIDNNDMLRLGRRGQLSSNVAFLMLKGAGYAAIVVLLIWLGIAFLGWFGRTVLPEDSRDNPDPINRSGVLIEPAAQRFV